MSNFKNFTTAAARPLPVILLLDTSGSMSKFGKIQALNLAVSEMVKTFCDEDSARVEIQVAIITFGGEKAVLFQDLQTAQNFMWKDLVADGQTPMGSAFQIAKDLIEDRNKILSRSYAPTIVLVSDGHPTKEPSVNWQEALDDLINSPRASKAARLSMAIGDDADMEMLKKFLSNDNDKVKFAHEASDIRRLFQKITMSVTSRSRSSNPNQIPPTETEDDDIDY